MIVVDFVTSTLMLERWLGAGWQWWVSKAECEEAENCGLELLFNMFKFLQSVWS
jgi:hypothetical protein